jgi:hypothetical protein
MPNIAFPIQYPTGGGSYPVPTTLIPVELDIEGLYEDYDGRRSQGGSGDGVVSNVGSVFISYATHK